MASASSATLIRSRDGSVVHVGDTWSTGDVFDLDGKLVERGKAVELIAATIPEHGEGRIGKITVNIGGTITRGDMMVRSDHPGFPGQRVAFVEV